jgi:hypothetical protein
MAVTTENSTCVHVQYSIASATPFNISYIILNYIDILTKEIDTYKFR